MPYLTYSSMVTYFCQLDRATQPIYSDKATNGLPSGSVYMFGPWNDAEYDNTHYSVNIL